MHSEDATDLKEVQELELADLERYKKLLPADSQAVLDQMMSYLDQTPPGEALGYGQILEQLPTQVSCRREGSMVEELSQQKKPTWRDESS